MNILGSEAATFHHFLDQKRDAFPVVFDCLRRVAVVDECKCITHHAGQACDPAVADSLVWAPGGERSLQSMILPTDERTLFVALNTDEASDAYERTCTKFRRGRRSEDELKCLWGAYHDLKETLNLPQEKLPRFLQRRVLDQVACAMIDRTTYIVWLGLVTARSSVGGDTRRIEAVERDFPTGRSRTVIMKLSSRTHY